jgi:hypothetical protein
MDITPQGDQQQPISDDQELAKALAGVIPDAPDAVVPDATPVATAPQYDPTIDPAAAVPQFAAPSDLPQPSLPPLQPSAPVTVPSNLDGIKQSALGELRPLIDKVDLPADEKFDTYLMLIRSTDDSSLIEPAHAAAQSIVDETRRAEALLDIIKEIDYLSRNNQQPIA